MLNSQATKRLVWLISHLQSRHQILCGATAGKILIASSHSAQPSQKQGWCS